MLFFTPDYKNSAKIYIMKCIFKKGFFPVRQQKNKNKNEFSLTRSQWGHNPYVLLVTEQSTSQRDSHACATSGSSQWECVKVDNQYSQLPMLCSLTFLPCFSMRSLKRTQKYINILSKVSRQREFSSPQLSHKTSTKQLPHSLCHQCGL